MSPFKTLADGLTARMHQDRLEEVTEDPRDPRTLTVRVPSGKLTAAAKYLKEKEFDYLSFVTAVDFKQHLEVVYWFTSLGHKQNVRVKCHLPPAKPEIESLVSLYPTADWNEREVYDLFGIVFKGHPDLRRIVTYDEFKDHPLLKKYKIIDDPDEFPSKA